jgi:uncharacterized protein YlxP (DUF503 family)
MLGFQDRFVFTLELCVTEGVTMSGRWKETRNILPFLKCVHQIFEVLKNRFSIDIAEIALLQCHSCKSSPWSFVAAETNFKVITKDTYD